MTLKNIGVFVDATPEGEKRIDYAGNPRRAVRRPPCRDLTSYLRFGRSIDPIIM